MMDAAFGNLLGRAARQLTFTAMLFLNLFYNVACDAIRAYSNFGPRRFVIAFHSARELHATRQNQITACLECVRLLAQIFFSHQHQVADHHVATG